MWQRVAVVVPITCRSQMLALVTGKLPGSGRPALSVSTSINMIPRLSPSPQAPPSQADSLRLGSISTLCDSLGQLNTKWWCVVALPFLLRIGRALLNNHSHPSTHIGGYLTFPARLPPLCSRCPHQTVSTTGRWDALQTLLCSPRPTFHPYPTPARPPPSLQLSALNSAGHVSLQVAATLRITLGSYQPKNAPT